MCESFATRAEEGLHDADPMRGVGAGHFRRSNSLRPTKAAAAKMGGCPASWGSFKVATYSSFVDAKAHVGAKDGTIDHDDAGVLRYHDGGTWTDAGSNGVAFDERSSGTSVLLPLAAGRYAHVDVGAILLGRCGRLGEIDVTLEAGVWRVTYQAHKGVPGRGPTVCFCDEESGSESCQPGAGDAEQSNLPPCACQNPICPMTCGDEDEPAGPHVGLYVDSKSGAGLWRTEVDHAYADQVTLAVDIEKHHLEATGLGREASVRLGPP